MLKDIAVFCRHRRRHLLSAQTTIAEAGEESIQRSCNVAYNRDRDELILSVLVLHIIP
jgi:hypothetical protein